MKKTLIRGVALILVALSMLVLASACGSNWYDTTYTVKAYSKTIGGKPILIKNDGKYPLGWNYGKAVTVKPLDKKEIPTVKISVGKLYFPLFSDGISCNCKIPDVEKTGKNQYVGSYTNKSGDDKWVFTFLRGKDPETGKTVNELKMDLYYYTFEYENDNGRIWPVNPHYEYMGTLYAYD